jgi:hypothetical protein
MPPPEPARVAPSASAPAPALAPAPAPAPSNPNGLEEFPATGPGWNILVQIVLRIDPLGGTHHLQHPSAMVGVTRHHLPCKTALTATRIRVSNPNFELKARTLEELTSTIPREGVTNTSPSPLTREDVTLAMTMHAMCVKRPGIKMVSPLLKLGLSNHTFVFMCVLLPLELSEHCSYP